MDLDQLLAGLRIGFYLGIFVMIGVVYKPHKSANWRPGISAVATLLAGVSLALAVINVLTWTPIVATVKELMTTMFVGLVFLATIRSKGNVAKIFSKGAWR